MNPPAPRTYLGSAHSLVERVRVYWMDKGLEVDSSEGYEIRRTRVLFDEVLLVTLHSRLGGTLPWLPILVAALVGFLAAIFESEPLPSRILAWTALGFLAIGIVAFFMPQWVVTVFGRRTRARLQFRLRERKARDVFARICQAADEAQRSLRAAEPIQEIPPEPPPLPLSDSESPIAPE
ncbi:MAG TPA: hypothetical protein VH394_29730 [Thermoanaerobaculia bacterium]|nr:hypothetical protein [Thermoanaerobaculia bacterium]